jgi:hypothetical protein
MAISDCSHSSNAYIQFWCSIAYSEHACNAKSVPWCSVCLDLRMLSIEHEYVFHWLLFCMHGPGSIVGIATGYRLDGLGIESRWGWDFPHLSRPALWSTQPPVQWVRGLSWGVNGGWGMTLTPHPLLVPWSRKGRAIPLLPLWAVRPVQSLSACTKVHFTLHFTATLTLHIMSYRNYRPQNKVQNCKER